MVQSFKLREARSEPVLVHGVEEFLCDGVPRCLGNHSVNAAMRAQSSKAVSILDPFFDLSGIVDSPTVEAAASRRCLELLVVRRAEAVGFDDVGRYSSMRLPDRARQGTCLCWRARN